MNAEAYEHGMKYCGPVPEVRFLPVSAIERQEMDFRPEVMTVSDEVARNMDFSEPVETIAFRFGRANDDQLPVVTLKDGHHRTAAALQTGRPYLPVTVKAINAKGEKIMALIALSKQIEATLQMNSGDAAEPAPQTTRVGSTPGALACAAPPAEFEASAIRGVSGLIPIWHGSDRVFEQFNEQGDTYLGIYGSSLKDYSTTFGRYIRPMYMRISHPFVVDMDDRQSPHYATSQGEIVIDGRIIGFYRHLTLEAIAQLKVHGFDGITARFRGIEFFEVVAFDSSQIHWAGNAERAEPPAPMMDDPVVVEAALPKRAKGFCR